MARPTRPDPAGRLPFALLAALPAGVAVVALGALAVVMDHGRAWGLPLVAVNAAALAYFALVVAAPLALWPLAFRRGVPVAGRVALSLAPGLAWWLSEVAFRAGTHGLAAGVYLNLSFINYLHLQVLALEMALAELGCRVAADRPKGRPVVATLAVLAWLASDALVVEAYYLGFQETWRDRFMARGALDPPRDAAPGPLGPEPLARTRAPERLPNVVVILADDHRHDFAGHAGHPFVRTPSLDRLAAEGVRFENAFVTSSLCSPSRASLLTGLQPLRHGVRNNFTPWDPGHRTFFEYLSRVGYRTAFVGKWHMPGGLPDLRGVDHFVTFTVRAGQGVYEHCPLVVDGRPEPSRQRYIARELTDRALDWLDAHRDEPFVLYLSHKNVHAPFTPDPREAGRHAGTPVPLPPGAPHSFFALTDGQYAHGMLRPIERIVRRYAEAVESMDREIGRVLARLDQLGLADRTLVLYTSDNGYLFGEHGLVDKRWPHEPSIRVPWLVRYPPLQRAAGASVERMVLNLDLAPSLLDLAGVAVPDTMQGRSLLPLLADPEAPWRDAFDYDYVFEPPFPVPTVRAVRTDRHKYAAYDGRPPELYDLARDPAERENRAGDPAFGPLEAALRDRLARLAARAR